MKSARPRTSLSEINITPLVDVMLVLLVIFMVTAPAMKQGLEVELPRTASTGLAATSQPFYVSIQKSGRVFMAGQPVPMSQLRAKLKSVFKNRQNKQVYIQADKKALYDYVARVMAEVSAAGISNIGLVTQALPR